MRYGPVRWITALIVLILSAPAGECREAAGSYATPQLGIEWVIKRESGVRFQITGTVQNRGVEDLVDPELVVRVIGNDGKNLGDARFVFHPQLLPPAGRLPFGMLVDHRDSRNRVDLEFNFFFGAVIDDTVLPGFIQFSVSSDELPVPGAQ